MINRCMELDQHKRISAESLLNDMDWIQCKDVPMSIQQRSGQIHRQNRMQTLNAPMDLE